MVGIVKCEVDRGEAWEVCKGVKREECEVKVRSEIFLPRK